MLLDPEQKALFRRKLDEAVQEQIAGLVNGVFPEKADYERQRGVIVGLGIALDLLEDKPKEPKAADLPEDTLG